MPQDPKDKKIAIISIVLFALVLIIGTILIIIRFQDMNDTTSTTKKSTITSNDNTDLPPFAFRDSGLQTDTSISSINLDLVLSGGPSKDGIPAMTNPTFTSIDNADDTITDEIRGILVQVGDDIRWYPYNILVWHEIVNDTVGGKQLVITFCPLCGSAIVFDAIVDGETYKFGVSGKLYESNLLMYDRTTESLWSQTLGEAVVGTLTGKTLTHFPFQLLTFEEVKRKYSSAQIQSTDTGYSRDYSLYPYGDYEESERLTFPVSVDDKRYFEKEIVYAVNIQDTSVAFIYKTLKEVGTGTIEVNGSAYTASYDDGEVNVRKNGSDDIIPGYFEMWFSWATHHQDGGLVWDK